MLVSVLVKAKENTVIKIIIKKKMSYNICLGIIVVRLKLNVFRKTPCCILIFGFLRYDILTIGSITYTSTRVTKTRVKNDYCK